MRKGGKEGTGKGKEEGIRGKRMRGKWWGREGEQRRCKRDRKIRGEIRKGGERE